MAHIEHRGSRQRVVVPVSLMIFVLLAAACGGPPPAPSATVAPVVVVTPNPHLADPATAQEVFTGLGRAGLKISPNTAMVGAAGTGIVTRTNATYLGWPLDVTEYRTSADLAKAAAWKKGEKPGLGEPPVALAGYNIMVTWGPHESRVEPPIPDDLQAQGLTALVSALDNLLSPIRVRANVALQVADAPASTEPGPSAAPKATPAP